MVAYVTLLLFLPSSSFVSHTHEKEETEREEVSPGVSKQIPKLVPQLVGSISPRWNSLSLRYTYLCALFFSTSFYWSFVVFVVSCDRKSSVENCNGHGDKIVAKKTFFILDKSVSQHLSCHDGEDLPTLDVAPPVSLSISYVIKLFRIESADI